MHIPGRAVLPGFNLGVSLGVQYMYSELLRIRTHYHGERVIVKLDGNNDTCLLYTSLDRERLLKATLATFHRSFKKDMAGWFAGFFETLQPTTLLVKISLKVLLLMV